MRSCPVLFYRRASVKPSNILSRRAESFSICILRAQSEHKFSSAAADERLLAEILHGVTDVLIEDYIREKYGEGRWDGRYWWYDGHRYSPREYRIYWEEDYRRHPKWRPRHWKHDDDDDDDDDDRRRPRRKKKKDDDDDDD